MDILYKVWNAKSQGNQSKQFDQHNIKIWHLITPIWYLLNKSYPFPILHTMLSCFKHLIWSNFTVSRKSYQHFKVFRNKQITEELKGVQKPHKAKSQNQRSFFICVSDFINIYKIESHLVHWYLPQKYVFIFIVIKSLISCAHYKYITMT